MSFRGKRDTQSSPVNQARSAAAAAAAAAAAGDKAGGGDAAVEDAVRRRILAMGITGGPSAIEDANLDLTRQERELHPHL